MNGASRWSVTAVAVSVVGVAILCPRPASSTPASSRHGSAPIRADSDASPDPDAPTIASPANQPIPGGGRIVFSGQGVSHSSGIGMVEADGTVRFVDGRFGDATWDPLHPGGIMVAGTDDGTSLYRLTDGGWVRSGRWRTGPDYYSRLSPDGRWVAHKVFGGGRETPLLQAMNRQGNVRRFPLSTSSKVAWQAISWLGPGQAIVASEPDGNLFVWNVHDGAVRPFLGLADLGPLASGRVEDLPQRRIRALMVGGP